MDFVTAVDIFLHLDKHLAAIVDQYGVWVYAILFTIIFVETGLVVMPFLPGDSLLFIVGALAGIGSLSLPLAMGLLIAAAILGDALNYAIGHKIGPKVFKWEKSRWFNKEAFNRTHAFYEKHGAITIIVARFIPFARTFAPFVAGVAQMTYRKFGAYNIIGGVLWVGSLTTLGYFVGNLPWVQKNFSVIALAMIIIPGLPAVFEVARHTLFKRKAK